MTQLEYYNLGPETRARLQKKSLYLFKSKHRWRSIEEKLGCGVVELERQMDEHVALMEKRSELMRKIKTEEKNVKELKRKNG